MVIDYCYLIYINACKNNLAYVDHLDQNANQTADMRKVMTVIYMDQDMRLKAPESDGQQNDWDTWCPGAQIGEIINSPLNPVLYP